jgi:hypothetical protein
MPKTCMVSLYLNESVEILNKHVSILIGRVGSINKGAYVVILNIIAATST